jgi:nucleoside-diphosphate-sugar epimerase
MRAFVTGASGFLGGRLAELLVEQGFEVVALVRATADERHLSHLPIRLVRGDLGSKEMLKDVVRSVSHIYHCAACSTDWAGWQTYYEANVVGTENLLAAARTAKDISRFLHVSTTDVYGYPNTPCEEENSLMDVGLPYNRTKLLGERAVWRAQQESSLPITIVRPATIYGPRGKAFVVDIAELLRQGLMAYISSGRCTGGFTYVDNVAEAMIQASMSQQTLGNAYNISDGSGATWKQYVSGLAKGLGLCSPRINLPFTVAISVARALEFPHGSLKIPGRPLLTRHAVYLLGKDQEFPIGKAKRDFNFSPKVSFTEGIERSIAWLKSSSEAWLDRNHSGTRQPF